MIKSLIVYFQFFTRIPINIVITDFKHYYHKWFSLFGLFGIIYSLIIAGVYLISRLALTVEVSMIVVLLIDTLLTGGFHHDALSDAMDGLFSARNKEQKLAIMKDSRIGANGTIALIIYYLIMTHVTTDILVLSSSLLNEFFVVSSLIVISRGTLANMHRQFRYVSATPNGLGSMLVGIKTRDIIVTQVIISLWLYMTVGSNFLLAYYGVLLLMELYKKSIYQTLDGMNGDTTGASVLISQMIYVVFISGFI